MGCGGSKAVVIESQLNQKVCLTTNQENEVTTPEQTVVEPIVMKDLEQDNITIHANIGARVKPFKPDGARVIFLMGGVGALKGLVADHIVCNHRYKLISIEATLLELGRELIADATPDVDVAAMHDVDVVTFLCKPTPDDHLDAALRRVVATLALIPTQSTRIVLDIVPNNTKLLQSGIFKGAAKTLMRYERTELNADMILLLVPEHKDRPHPSKDCITTPTDADGNAKLNTETKSDAPPPPLNVQARVSQLRKKKSLNDEACPLRRGRRSFLFNSISDPLVTMFETAQQLVRVFVPDGVSQAVLPKLNNHIDKLLHRQEQEAVDFDVNVCFQLRQGTYCHQPNSEVVTIHDLGIVPSETEGLADPVSWNTVIDAFVIFVLKRRATSTEATACNMLVNLEQLVLTDPEQEKETDVLAQACAGEARVVFGGDIGYKSYTIPAFGLHICLSLSMRERTRLGILRYVENRYAFRCSIL